MFSLKMHALRIRGTVSFSNDRGSHFDTKLMPLGRILFPYGRPQPCQAGSSRDQFAHIQMVFIDFS